MAQILKLKSGSKQAVFLLLLALLPQKTEAVSKKQRQRHQKSIHQTREQSEVGKKRFMGYDSGSKGISLLLGQPAGVRYQTWQNSKQSLFFDLAYDWERVLLAGANYSFYFYNVDDLWKTKSAWNALLFYIGGGGFVGLGVSNPDPNNRYQIGLRAFGGMEYLFSGGPWSLKAEVGPKLFFVGRTVFGLQGMIGITYSFSMDRKSKSQLHELPAQRSNETMSVDEEGDMSLEDDF